VAEHNKLLDEVRVIGKQLSEIQRTARERLKAVYKVTKVIKVKDGHSGREGIQIIKELQNEAEYDKHLKTFGSCLNKPTVQIRSVLYFRINGVLCREGGGTIIFDDYALCSDEEWAQILEGNIPERLKR
jgi:hypothetical protein